MKCKNSLLAKANALFLIVLFLVVGACSTSTSPISLENKTLESNYNKSLDIWNKAKAENGGNYEYAITQSSLFGWFAKTVITVKDNKVVGRKYYDNEADKVKGTLALVYEESGSDVNKNEKGVKATTLDQVYADCAEYSLTKSEETHNITFKTDDAGMLSVCGFCEKGVMDDCFRGTSVQDFKWL